MEDVMQAAAAARRVKDAYTIDEKELLALRPTLLKGFAFMQQQCRQAFLSVSILNDGTNPAERLCLHVATNAGKLDCL